MTQVFENIRRKHPEYAQYNDEDLAFEIWKKMPGMDWNEFRVRSGLSPDRSLGDHLGELGGAVWSGAQRAALGVRTYGDVLLDDEEGVREKAEQTFSLPTSYEQEAFQRELTRRTDEHGDDSWVQGAKNVAGAAWDQPIGAVHEIAGQLPNSAVIMGSMATGAKLGALGGSVVPGVGNAVGAIFGGALGLLAGNIAIEGGFIAQEAMAEGDYDRDEVLEQSLKKGGTIAAFDMATININKLIFGAAGRAARTAVAARLAEKGIDAADDAAVAAAFAANPALRRELADVAANTARGTVTGRVARGTTAVGLESASEGMGQYWGSVAADMDASYTEAVMEAMMALPQSGGEAAWSAAWAARDRARSDRGLPGAAHDVPPERQDDPVVAQVRQGLAGMDDQRLSQVVQAAQADLNNAANIPPESADLARITLDEARRVMEQRQAAQSAPQAPQVASGPPSSGPRLIQPQFGDMAHIVSRMSDQDLTNEAGRAQAHLANPAAFDPGLVQRSEAFMQHAMPELQRRREAGGPAPIIRSGPPPGPTAAELGQQWGQQVSTIQDPAPQTPQPPAPPAPPTRAQLTKDPAGLIPMDKQALKGMASQMQMESNAFDSWMQDFAQWQENAQRGPMPSPEQAQAMQAQEQAVQRQVAEQQKAQARMQEQQAREQQKARQQSVREQERTVREEARQRNGLVRETHSVLSRAASKGMTDISGQAKGLVAALREGRIDNESAIQALDALKVSLAESQPNPRTAPMRTTQQSVAVSGPVDATTQISNTVPSPTSDQGGSNVAVSAGTVPGRTGTAVPVEPAPEGGVRTGDVHGRIGRPDVPADQILAGARGDVKHSAGAGTESFVYAVVDADHVRPSHAPTAGFGPTQGYPYQNERNYQTDQEEQSKVQNHAHGANFTPGYFVEHSVDANHGAPVTDADLNVLGGNGRAQSLKLVYGRGDAAAIQRYRDALTARAAELGIDPDAVAGMNRPMLVRVLDTVQDQARGQELIPALNDTFTQAVHKPSKALGRFHKISQKTLNLLGVGSMRHETLRKFLDSQDSKSFVDGLLQDDVILPVERSQYLDKDGALNPDGKVFVEQTLRGVLVEDYQTLEGLPPSMLTRLDKTLPSVLVLKMVGGKWDVSAQYRDAVRLAADFVRSTEKSIEKFLSTGDMLGTSDPAKSDPLVRAMIRRILDTKQWGLNKYGELWTRFAGDAKMGAQGKIALPGMSTTFEVALEKAFGVKVASAATQGTTQTAPATPPTRTEPPPQTPPDRAGASPAPTGETAPTQTPAGAPLAGAQGATPEALPTLWKDLMTLGRELGVFKVGMKRAELERAILDARAGQDAEGDSAPATASKEWGASNTLVTQADREAIRARMRAKFSGTQLNMGMDPELMLDGMRLAVFHIEAGARRFADYSKAMIEELGDAVRPYLKVFYNAARDWPDAEAAGLTRDMDGHAEVEQSFKEMQDAATEHAGDVLEQDSPGTEPGVGVGEGGLRPGRPGVAGQGGSGVAGVEGARAGQQGGQRTGGPQAPPAGTQSPVEVSTGQPGSDAGRGVAGDQRAGRGGSHGRDGSHAGQRAAGSTPAPAPGSDRVAKIQAQKAADKIAVVPNDRGNIAETLPALFEGQHDDVKFAEERFSRPDQAGVLFTNSTGTGKTGSGLGIVKRFVRQGKDNVLIVAPSDKVNKDWLGFAKDYLGLDITQLPDTNTAGSGVVVTTYANLRNNPALADRKWDLVVLDEAQHVLQSAKGEKTMALDNLRAITMHPKGVFARARMLHPEESSQMDALREQMDDLVAKIRDRRATQDERDQAHRQHNELRRKQRALHATIEATRLRLQSEFDAAQGTDARPKVVFLSATPFAYETSVDLAEGYLFDYPQASGTGYNSPDGQQLFMIQHFGYRMRNNKLTKPGPEVDRGLMQRNFNEWLKQNGVVSGRMLDLPFDYDRRFIVTPSAEGTLIDQALEFLSNDNRMKPLQEYIEGQFDYLSRRYLLEAIKAREVIPIIQQHLDMGRKVVVFHDYKKGGGVNPFRVGGLLGSSEEFVMQDGSKVLLSDLAQEFMDANPALMALDFSSYRSPIDTLTQAFGDRLALFNGSVPATQRQANVQAFQDENSGVDVILAQSAAGKEGISLHDRTGAKQRVLINLGLPTTPTTSIQQEGRIYRYGQASDAIIRYMTTGTNWERFAFARTIAERASAAENLALGNDARGLLDSFVNAYMEADDYAPGHAGEGTGGKEIDRALRQALTEWDRAMAAFHGNLRKTSRTKAAEGVDYFATPEPLGLKMVEWSDTKAGEETLEPSAGHGAIARWFPETVDVTFIEPSSELASRASLVTPHGKLLQHRFEDLHSVNKYDTIVMNPPFGSGGATARDHLAKAATHLRNGGRIVAIVPTGPAADAKIDKWLNSDEAKNIYQVAEILLPTSTFDRAGTKVATRILVLDKLNDSSLAQGIVSRRMDLSDAASQSELFGRAKDMSLPPRRALPPAQKVQDVPLDQAKIVTHITLKGRVLRGVIRKNITIQDAKKIDPYAIRKGKGKVFIREQYLDDLRRWEDTGEFPSGQQAQPQAPPQYKPGDPLPAGATGEFIGNFPVVEHVTAKGKKIYGVVRTDMTRDQAREIDRFTFRKGDGFFVRTDHKSALEAFDARQDVQAAPESPRMSVSNIRTAPIDYSKIKTGQRAGMRSDAVREALGGVMAAATGASETVILDSQDQIKDVSPEAWEQIRAKGHDKNVIHGFFFGGKTYLIAENLQNRKHALEIWLHEQIGHGGVEAVLGDQAHAFYEMLRRAEKLPTIDAAKEYLAEIVQKLNVGEKLNAGQRSFWQKALDWIRKHIFRMGAKPMLTRSDLAQIIQESLNTAKYLDVIQAAAEQVFLGEGGQVGVGMSGAALNIQYGSEVQNEGGRVSERNQAGHARVDAGTGPRGIGFRGIEKRDLAASGREIRVGGALRRGVRARWERQLDRIRQAASQEGAAEKDRERLSGIELSEDFANSDEFLHVHALFRESGYSVIPIKDVAWGGVVLHDRGIVLVSDARADGLVEYYALHEMEHVRQAQGDPEALALMERVDENSEAALAYSEITGLFGEELRMEIAAAKVAADASGTHLPLIDDVFTGVDSGRHAHGQPLYKIVYHGGPHVWAPEPGFPHGRPRLDKIGTGEGAAVYGWGWYSAEAEGVARSYRQQLSNDYDTVRLDGNPVDMKAVQKVLRDEIGVGHSLGPIVKDAMSRVGRSGDVDTAIQEIDSLLGREDMDAWPAVKYEMTKQKELLERLRGRITTSGQAGSLYKLDIPDDVIPKLLDWDRPLSEQSEFVRKLLEKEFGDSIIDDGKTKLHDRFGVWESKGLTGERLYDDIQQRLGGKQAASEYLRSIGIPGSKYLDGMSRDAGQGSQNFVIWDQDVLDQIALLERNGEALDAIRVADGQAPEAPRFSMSDPATQQPQAHADAVMTQLDHVFAGTSLEGLGELMAKKGKSVLPENVRLMLPENDMGRLHAFGLPAWQAKNFKTYGKVFDREQERRAESSSMRAEIFREIEDFMNMDRATEAGLREMYWGEHGIEGTKLSGEEGVTEPRYIEEEDSQGRVIRFNGPNLLINPAYYAQLESALRKRFAPGGQWAHLAGNQDALVRLFTINARMLDKRLLDIYDTLRMNLGDSDNDIQLYRNFISTGMHNYFPHNRYGKYYVRAVNKQGDTVYREHFDLNLKRFRRGGKARALRVEGERRIGRLREQYNDPDLTWEINENRDLPEDVYSFPIPMDAMEQILKKAEGVVDQNVDRIVGYHLRNATPEDVERAKKGMKAALSGLLPRSVADTLKERGFLMHAISRKNIPGFEQQDLKKVMYDYVTGFSGWITKIEAAKDFAKMMSELDAVQRPREYQAVTQYVQDMLRNQDDIDRMAGNIKSLFFANYLGLNIKTAMLNLTQNVILGVPRLAMDVGAGQAMRWYKDAGRLMAQEMAGQGGLSDGAKHMLENLYARGILDARYLNEIRGRVSKVGVSTAWDKVLHVMGLPMAWSDKFNRASLALAAYESAVNGKVTNEKTLRKFGMKKGQKFPHEYAETFAADVANDSHFVYGKSNAPEILRSTGAGRIISPIYTFRTFSHNLWNAWLYMFREGGPEGRRALAMSLLGTIAMGGLKSIPLYASFLALWNASFGDDDDPVEWVREQIPQVDGGRPNLLRDISTYGLPAVLGVNLGGSIRMETPMLPNLKPGDTMSQAATNIVKDMFGIPWDFFVERTSKAAELARAGDHDRALEEMAPFFVKNMMQALRFYKEGATAVSGRPIALPGEVDPRKITMGEALGKAVGFQPLSSTKAWDMHASLQRTQGVKQRKQSAWMSRLARARRAGDRSEATGILQEIQDWNRKALEKGEVWNIIRSEDIVRAQQMRDKPKQAPVMQRGRARELAEMYE